MKSEDIFKLQLIKMTRGKKQIIKEILWLSKTKSGDILGYMPDIFYGFTAYNSGQDIITNIMLRDFYTLREAMPLKGDVGVFVGRERDDVYFDDVEVQSIGGGAEAPLKKSYILQV